LPVLQEGFAGNQRLPKLAGNGHQDHIGAGLLIVLMADDDRWTLLVACRFMKGKPTNTTSP
jgi:hypothetical protein